MATYYIATTGNDTTGDGSSGNPWLTISKAHTAASSGDTVMVAAGTYTWTDQTFTKSLTIIGAGITQTVFNGGGAAIRWTLGAYTLSVSGIKFTGSLLSNNGVFIVVTDTILIMENCLFSGLTINASTLGGIIGINGGVVPISITLTSCIFDNCKNSGNALIGVRSWTGTHTVTITGCTIIFTDATAACDYLFTFQSATSALSIVMKNTIVYNTTGTTIATINEGSPTITATYCDFYTITSSPTGTGVITSDPLFVDAANGDFHLRPSSPCINTGTLI